MNIITKESRPPAEPQRAVSPGTRQIYSEKQFREAGLAPPAAPPLAPARPLRSAEEAAEIHAEARHALDALTAQAASLETEAVECERSSAELLTKSQEAARAGSDRAAARLEGRAGKPRRRAAALRVELELARPQIADARTREAVARDDVARAEAALRDQKLHATAMAWTAPDGGGERAYDELVADFLKLQDRAGALILRDRALAHASRVAPLPVPSLRDRLDGAAFQRVLDERVARSGRVYFRVPQFFVSIAPTITREELAAACADEIAPAVASDVELSPVRAR